MTIEIVTSVEVNEYQIIQENNLNNDSDGIDVRIAVDNYVDNLDGLEHSLMCEEDAQEQVVKRIKDLLRIKI